MASSSNSINPLTIDLPSFNKFVENASREELEAISKDPEVPMTKNAKGRTEINTYKYITVSQLIDSLRKYGLGAIYIENDTNGGNKPFIGKTASFNKAVYHDGKYYNLLQILKIQIGGSVREYQDRIKSQKDAKLEDNEINHQPSLMFTNVLPKEDENGDTAPFDDDLARANEFMYALLLHDKFVSRKWEFMIEDFGWECTNKKDKVETKRASDARALYGLTSNNKLEFNSSFKPYKKTVKDDKTGQIGKVDIEGKYLINLTLMKTDNILKEEFLNVNAKKVNNKGKTSFAEMLVDGKRLSVHNCHEVFKYGLQLTGILSLGSIRSGGTGTSNKYSFGKLFDFKNPKAPVTIYIDPNTIKSHDDDDDDKNLSIFGDSDLVSQMMANAKNINEETAEVLNIIADDNSCNSHDNDNEIDNIISQINDTV